ncbi:hypothetical protein ACFCYB_31695 [Streptomyces sp. NPDC056309]|uniref:hypothetical protein n=1 Tax=unclassified Streptomyces TaxID=2593676 RepID=UPI0035DDF679
MPEEPIRSPRSGRDRRRDVIAAVITCSAIGAAIVHVVKPDLKIDAVTAVLLAVAAVPWLGALFDSIELPAGRSSSTSNSSTASRQPRSTAHEPVTRLTTRHAPPVSLS